ncbi:hypothetical protein GCM10011331_20750 [Flavimobilis marinus]|nr:hypothetical protein GCM10011331_20750 [Flavimobilis marinus]
MTVTMAVVGMPAASAASHAVTGTLVSASGEPLAGLKVRAVPAAGYGSVGATTTVTTNAEGSFSLPMPKAGTRFLLEAFDPARTEASASSPECREPARTSVLTTFIGSRGKQTFTDLDPITGYKARSGSSISSGTHELTASSGFDLTITGAEEYERTVTVLRADGQEAYWGECGALDHGFMPGRYTVVVGGQGYDEVRIPATLTRGEVEKHAVTLKKTPKATVTGKVVMGGKPVDMAVVVATTGDKPVVAISDEDGSYKLTAPAGKPLTITANGAGAYAALGRTSISLEAGASTRLDITEKPTTDRGVVRGRFVRPSKSSWGSVELRTAGGDVVASADLDNREVFHLGAPAGSYRLVYVDGRNNLFSYTSVRVAAGQTTQLGNVSVTRKTAKIYGDVAAGTKLTATILSGKSDGFDYVSGGRYRLEDLIPGKYTVRFDRPGYVSKTVTVTARSTKRLTPPRLAKRSVVKGVIVYAANSKRVATDAMVHATLTSKRTGDVAARSVTDHDASFTIAPRGVTRGRYAVELSAPDRDARCSAEPGEVCYPPIGVNAWRSPYFWDGREVFTYSGGSNNLSTVKVALRNGL